MTIVYLSVMCINDLERPCLLLQPDFADLNDRSNVGVLGNVALEDVGVGEKGACERLDGVAGETADGGERRHLVGSSAKHTDLNGNSFDGGTEQSEHERYVRVDVVIHIEVSAGLARVEDRNLDHLSTIRRCGVQSGWTNGFGSRCGQLLRAAPRSSSSG